MIKKEDMTDGLYYVKEKHGVEVGDWDSDHKQWNGIWGGDDTEVLAPVPSYYEWKELIENEAKSHLQADSYYNEILELKDLLKECKIYVENFIEGSTLINKHHISYILLQRIKEVLK